MPSSPAKQYRDIDATEVKLLIGSPSAANHAVPQSLLESQIGAVNAQLATLDSAIATLQQSGGGGGGTSSSDYERQFTQADLSVAGLLPVNHNLGNRPSGIRVWMGTGENIEPDEIEIVTVNAIAVNLQSFQPLVGTWTVSITR